MMPEIDKQNRLEQEATRPMKGMNVCTGETNTASNTSGHAQEKPTVLAMNHGVDHLVSE